jgi:tripeptidyl-peptidase II
MASSGRSFAIEADPTALPPGLHFAEVLGFDCSQGAVVGPIFRIPITVCKERDGNGSDTVKKLSNLVFEPGTIHREFVTVPTGSNFVGMSISFFST